MNSEFKNTINALYILACIGLVIVFGFVGTLIIYGLYALAYYILH